MPSDPTFIYPPLHHHTSSPLPTSTASRPLSAYLEKSLTRPYLHPDAWLSLEGVRHGPKSGPQGSWAIHHLRRIEAGMRGEVLEVESTEELVGKFGEEVVGEAMGVRRQLKRTEEEVVPEGGEEEEEEEVEEVREYPKQAPPPPASKPEHLMTKAEKKKARRAVEKAEIARARENGEEVPSFGRKRKRNNNNHDGDDDESQGRSEAGGDHHSSAGDEHTTVNVDINDPSQYTSAQSHALAQKPLLQDVGDRDPAGVEREDAVKVPVVEEHDVEGEVVVPGKKQKKRKGSTAHEEEGKEARRAAKKAKRQEGKKEKDGDTLIGDAPRAGPSRKEKRARREGEGNGTPIAAGGEKKGEKDVGVNGTPATTSEKKAKKSKTKKEKGEKSSS